MLYNYILVASAVDKQQVQCNSKIL